MYTLINTREFDSADMEAEDRKTQEKSITMVYTFQFVDTNQSYGINHSFPANVTDM